MVTFKHTFNSLSDAEFFVDWFNKYVNEYGAVNLSDIKSFVGDMVTCSDSQKGWCANISYNSIWPNYNYLPSVKYDVYLPDFNFDNSSNSKEEQDRSYSITFDIPVQNYVQDTDRFINIIKEGFNKAAEHKNSKVTIRFM